jgi:hypothetical protein
MFGDFVDKPLFDHEMEYILRRTYLPTTTEDCCINGKWFAIEMLHDQRVRFFYEQKEDPNETWNYQFGNMSYEEIVKTYNP